MTENKRFMLDDAGEVIDLQTAKFIEYGEEIVECLNNLHEENQSLKAQLLYDGDDVCGICKHEYLAPSGDYFIGKCEKGHEECSKEDIIYCKDFELKGDVE